MTHDVIISGAGPNGLMLSCELTMAGLRPLVLEALPAGAPKEPRANGLAGQVVRLMDRRGLYEPLSGDPMPPRPAPGFVFGALPLDFTVLDDNPMYLLPVPQLRIEQVLAERAAELGVEIRRGHELTGLTQDEDGVTVEVAGPEGAYELRARYLVGADGGHSATRKLAGIGFPGVTADDTVSRNAHVVVPDELLDPETGGLDLPGHGKIPPYRHRTERGLFVYARLPGRPQMVTTIEFGDEPDDENITLDEVRASVRRVLGVDLPMSPPTGAGPHLLRRRRGWNTRMAERYREGRVLLLGDAAHVHSAIGGPGLNLGLQDTVNLGWKLAAEVRGTAPSGLLDTYESERRPVAERVVMHTRAQSALIHPGSEVTGLRELFAELLSEPGNTRYIAELMSGAEIRYGSGDVHPLTGRWAPDLDLETDAGPVRLAELLRDARPLLLDLTGADWGDVPVRKVTGKPLGEAPAAALLIRPDGYVAWAADGAYPDDQARAGLAAACSRWFG